MNQLELTQYVDTSVLVVRDGKDILGKFLWVDGQPHLTFPNTAGWEQMMAYRLSDSEIEAFRFDKESRVVRSSIVLD